MKESESETNMDINTFLYVINAPYFWLSMGITTSMAIFVGAIIYDGNLSNAYKGIISVLLYSFFIAETTFTRVFDFFVKHPDKFDSTKYGGLATIMIVTFFWLVGILLGVITSKITRIHCTKSKQVYN